MRSLNFHDTSDNRDGFDYLIGLKMIKVYSGPTSTAHLVSIVIVILANDPFHTKTSCTSHG